MSLKIKSFNQAAIMVRALLKQQKFWIPIYVIINFMLFNTALNMVSVASTFKNILGVAIITLIFYFNYLLVTKKDA